MRKLLALAPALLLASCHSAQVALRSQTATAEPIAINAPRPPLDSALAATVRAPRPTAADAPATARPARPREQVAPPRRALALRPLARLATTTTSMATPVAMRLAHRLQQRRPTEGAAENGLGRVALFFIGVVLAVLAGLAALVNLIFSVGFFTALGYTAAGLVVLFLLYSLFSGGKKKK